MKKILISVGSLLIMAFVIVLFINATESEKDPKKAKTEVSKTEAAPCSATCNHSGDKTATCDPEKCKELNCDHKDGKCDPATCTGHKEGEMKEGKACNHATTACSGTCHPKTSEGK